MEQKEANEDLLIDLRDILKNTITALNKRDLSSLAELSNRAIHISTIYRSKKAIYIGILDYSLSKVLDKITDEKKYQQFIDNISLKVENLLNSVEKRDFKRFDKSLKDALKLIAKYDASFSKYVEDVLEFSKVHKGAKMYEHGISLSSIAELLEVSKWELMKKVGETRVSEKDKLEVGSTKQRFKTAKKILKRKKKD